MRNLNEKECQVTCGALTDKEFDSILGKVGAYTANIGFLGLMYCTGFIGLRAFLIGGVGGSIAKIAGTYLIYENKEPVLNVLNNAKDYIIGTNAGYLP